MKKHIWWRILFTTNYEAGGYTVDIGVVEKRGTDENGKEYKNQLEIDFVANLGSKTLLYPVRFQYADRRKAYSGKGFSCKRKWFFLKKIIVVKDAVKEVGSYKAIVKLHKEVSVEIPFEVVAE